MLAAGLAPVTGPSTAAAAESTTSTAAVAAADTWASVGPGDQHTCAARVDGTLWCWGAMSYYATAVTRPQQVGTATDWLHVTAANQYSCGLRSAGSLWCWGNNESGQTTDAEPGADGMVHVSPSRTWVDVDAGHAFACAIASDLSLSCWGSNSSGQLGDASTTARWQPTQVSGTGWTQVSAGHHTCAVKTDRSLWCWGPNRLGQLGDGTTTDRLLPVKVTSLPAAAGSIDAEYHSCARLADESLWCWGYNFAGQLGSGTTLPLQQATPFKVVDAQDWTSVALGPHHSCGSRSSGGLWCWGWGDSWQLGDGENHNRSRPRKVGVGTGDLNGDGEVRWAVLGDSYISGEGLTEPATDFDGQKVGGYDIGTDGAANHCHRAPTSWAVRAAMDAGAPWEDLLFAACSGAVTADVIDNGQYPDSPYGVFGGQPQSQALADFAAKGAVDVVLVSIGGNDAKFGDVITECIRPYNFCRPQDQPALDTVRSRVQTALFAVKRAAPGARVLVSGYPNPVLPVGGSCGSLGGGTINDVEQYNVGQYLAALNSAVRGAAGDAGADYLDMYGLFSGVGICTGYGYMNGLSAGVNYHGLSVGDAKTFATAQESFHPTDEGHDRMHWFLRPTLRDRLSSAAPVGAVPDPEGPLRVEPGSRLHKVYGGQDGTVLQYYADRNEIVTVGTYSIPTTVTSLSVQAGVAVDVGSVLPKSLHPGWHLLEVRGPGGEVRAAEMFHVPDSSGCQAQEGPDSDGDALPDTCDKDPLDGPVADYDGDGVSNSQDNCLTARNNGQEDGNADRIGDACDVRTGGQPLAGSRTMTPSGGELSFPDVDGSHPFALEIAWLAESGITGGYSDGSFRPAVAVSRQAMAAFLQRRAGAQAFAGPAEQTFADVAPDHPFYDEIEWMAAQEISTGYVDPDRGKPLYKPADAVSRQAMAPFLYRAAGSPAFVTPTDASFADVAPDHPFFTAIEWMKHAGLSTGTPQDGGKPLYKPLPAVSRQAMAAFLRRSTAAA